LKEEIPAGTCIEKMMSQRKKGLRRKGKERNEGWEDGYKSFYL
jgi:hypothetical protein